MRLNICEIFYSLQGESTFTGLPCIFIRLSGCNLNCSWCDTIYAQDESESMSIDQILQHVQQFNCNLVEITGGEPLLQDATPVLINKLIENKFKVLLETNGSQSIEYLHPGCIKIIDIKCPSSNESNSFLTPNIDHLSLHDEIKFVVGSKKDYKFAKKIIETRLTNIQPANIHLSPVFGSIDPSILSAWILEDNLCARLSLQQHKVIWDPDKRGV
ncbi:MAG: radical SAM protein [Desulfobacula sp.]|nr:radical SAM protein [Desulfobacula sp.]